MALNMGWSVVRGEIGRDDRAKACSCDAQMETHNLVETTQRFSIAEYPSARWLKSEATDM